MRRRGEIGVVESAVLEKGLPVPPFDVEPGEVLRVAPEVVLAGLEGRRVRRGRARERGPALAEEVQRLAVRLRIQDDNREAELLLDFQAKNPAWDIVFVTTTSAAEWMRLGLVTPISTFMKENPALVDEKVLAKDDLYRTEDFTFDGNWVGFPTYSTGVALAWRTDVFNDATEKANFQKKYGYALKPPDTYAEFRDAAEFYFDRDTAFRVFYSVDRHK